AGSGRTSFRRKRPRPTPAVRGDGWPRTSSGHRGAETSVSTVPVTNWMRVIPSRTAIPQLFPKSHSARNVAGEGGENQHRPAGHDKDRLHGEKPQQHREDRHGDQVRKVNISAEYRYHFRPFRSTHRPEERDISHRVELAGKN